MGDPAEHAAVLFVKWPGIIFDPYLVDFICECFLSDFRQVTKAKRIVIKFNLADTTKEDLKQHTRT